MTMTSRIRTLIHRLDRGVLEPFVPWHLRTWERRGHVG